MPFLRRTVGVKNFAGIRSCVLRDFYKKLELDGIQQNEQSNQTDSLENSKNLREWHGYGMFIGEQKI